MRDLHLRRLVYWLVAVTATAAIGWPVFEKSSIACSATAMALSTFWFVSIFNVSSSSGSTLRAWLASAIALSFGSPLAYAVCLRGDGAPFPMWWIYVGIGFTGLVSAILWARHARA